MVTDDKGKSDERFNEVKACLAVIWISGLLSLGTAFLTSLPPLASIAVCLLPPVVLFCYFQRRRRT